VTARLSILTAWLLLLACYSPAEHSTVADCGVWKIRVSDNSLIGVLEGVPEARALQSVGNTEFLVSSGTGEIHIVNSPDMLITETLTVGFAGGAGYRSIIMPGAGSVYLTSSTGSILEIDLTGMSLVADFNAGAVPDRMAALPYSDEFFYVTDMSTGKILEVSTVTNSVTRESDALDAVPSAIAAESFLNSFLITVTSDETGLCGILNLGTFYFEEFSFGHACHDVTAFPAESIWAVSHPEWNLSSGSISICSNFSFPEVEAISIPGHPMQICSVPGTTLFYVLSYLGDGNSLLLGVNYLTRTIDSQMEIPGFPWDVTSHGNGEYVLVLTSEL